MDKYVLSIDCGTQSIRAIVFDSKGNLLVKSKKCFEPYYSQKPGWAEQDPKLYWDSLCEVTKDVNDKEPDIMDKIDSIVLTTQRDTCVLLDKDGNVLRPAIIWADQRPLKNKRKFPKWVEVSLHAVGMGRIAHNLSDKCPAHWIQDNQPEVWEKTYKYLLLSGYLNYMLTGEFADATANQIGHIPFNYKGFKWERKGALKREIFQIEGDKLVDIKPAGEILGYLTDDASNATGLRTGIKIIAGGSDKGCETLGVGCNDNSVAAISLGSQASIQTTANKYYEVMPFVPPFPAVVPNKYNPEIQVYRGYWMVSWFKKEFAQKEAKQAKKMGISPEEILNERIDSVPPGCDGLILNPYWGAGLKSPEAKGAIIGFSDIHTRAHIYRAIIEGIGFAILDGMKAIERKSKIKIKRIMISGGGSISDRICQITADIFNLPVCRVQSYETSSLGAAIVGYVANGTYADYDSAVENMVHPKDEFLPREEYAEVYKEIYDEIYKKTYGRLKPLYKKLYKILNTNYYNKEKSYE
jgi:sugar (pentulose or hexulose) kinase